jgi:hypothetical protein
MNIPETFYIALCVTILILGVIYWFWTQVQYLQRKVNLLDNVVYEMKTLVSNLPGPQVPPVPKFTAQTEYPIPDTTSPPQYDTTQAYEPPPESEAGDIDAERRASELEFESFSGSSPGIEMNVTETYAPPPSDAVMQPPVEKVVEPVAEPVENDDLRVGGLAAPVPSKKSTTGTTSDASIESPLNSMSIKDLRRMAEANGIPGAGELRKKELIAALRNKVSTIINEPAPMQVLSFDDIDAPNAE